MDKSHENLCENLPKNQFVFLWTPILKGTVLFERKWFEQFATCFSFLKTYKFFLYSKCFLSYSSLHKGHFLGHPIYNEHIRQTKRLALALKYTHYQPSCQVQA